MKRTRNSKLSKKDSVNPTFGKRQKVKPGSQTHLDERELDCSICGETIFNLLSDVGKVVCSLCTIKIAISYEKQEKEREELLKSNRKVGRPKKKDKS